MTPARTDQFMSTPIFRAYAATTGLRFISPPDKYCAWKWEQTLKSHLPKHKDLIVKLVKMIITHSANNLFKLL